MLTCFCSFEVYTMSWSVRLLVASLCVANCCAMNSEFAEFAKDPVGFFQDNQSRYNWLSDDMKKMLCQLPPLEKVRDKFAQWIKDNRQPEYEINLNLVKEKVKKFYRELLKDSGDIGEYLINVVNAAVEKTVFKYAEKIVAGESALSTISHGSKDAPPYLRIMGGTGAVSLDPDSQATNLGEEEKARYYEKLAREQKPEYDNKYEWKYIGLQRVNDHQVSECVEYKKKPQKIDASQPDFQEVDSKERWMDVFEREDKKKQDCDIAEAIGEEVHKAVQLWFMTEAESENAKYKFNDPQDQQKYETWLSKIWTRFQDPSKVTENFRVEVSYTSTQDAEYWITHEIAHMVEYAWRIKTQKRTVNENPELFSLYVETQLRNHKVMRLWEIYSLILVPNCLADFLQKKPNLVDMRQAMQSLEQLRLYDHELIEKNADAPENLQSESFHYHTYGLYNSIKLQEKSAPILEVLGKISTDKPAELTSQNFPELIEYLTN